MNPDGSSATQTIQSPLYPEKYPNNKDCAWFIKTKKDATITMVFDSFNVQWAKQCTKDYVIVGAIRKYTKVQLCGSTLPSTLKLKSKKNSMNIKFHSNASIRKSGFKAFLVAS